jgi:hypothetical protein
MTPRNLFQQITYYDNKNKPSCFIWSEFTHQEFPTKKMLHAYRVARWNIFVPKIISFDQFWRGIGVMLCHLVYFVAIWYIFTRFGMLH